MALGIIASDGSCMPPTNEDCFAKMYYKLVR